MILINEPLLEGNEKKYLAECIDTGWVSSEGPFVKKFESEISNYVNRKFGIAVSSGTAALDIAIRSLNIGKNDEVIMPTLTIISCANAIINAGAKPVLVDCDPYTFNMDVNQIREKITPKTKAILVVHLYGLACEMNDIKKIADEFGLKIIEDAAEMFGQEYKHKKCGSFGDISILSFYANKIITTGEGGMLLTDNEEIAKRCQYLRNLCFEQPRFQHREIGWNYRMTNLQAALGCAQFEQIEKFIKIKRAIGNFYNKALSGIENIQIPLSNDGASENIYWVYTIILNKKLKLEAKEFIEKLKKEGIETRPFFWCMHEQPVFKDLFKGERYPNAENLARNGFYLPSGLALKQTQQEIVIEKVKKLLQ